MLVIRFNRTGKKNQASFRVVLQEHTKAPGKRHVEILGSYDPHTKTTLLKKERILYWMNQGAKPSPVVTNLLIRQGMLQGKKITKKMPRPVSKEDIQVEEGKTEEVKTEEVTPVGPESVTVESTPVAEEVVTVVEDKKEETIPVA